MSTIDERYDRYCDLVRQYGQEHLLAFWDQLQATERAQLLDDLDQVDFAVCGRLIPQYVTKKPHLAIPTELAPPDALPAEPTPSLANQYREAVALGEQAIAKGQVAAFTVAGGQGTRLGFDGPKGAFQISPVRNAPLFQIFAENLLGTERRFGRRPRWYIMTSPQNHVQTTTFFAENEHFGLSRDDVVFFPQGQMPAFMPDGKIALAERHRLALSPDGHGGSLRALSDQGALADMRTHGVEYVSYFQVDNPLVRVIDPLFVGLHIQSGSEMSSKAVAKVEDTERVGNFCLADDKLTVIEYSDLPDELAHARNSDGSRRFDAGSIAIHIISRDFIERLMAPGAEVTLPWHRAEKKVAVVDANGQRVEPTSPNAVKLEMFVFDAVPLARNPLVMYTHREEEFSPVKNAVGVDSAVTTRRDLIRRAVRWLEAAGVTVPRGTDDEPAMPIEISPVFALDAADLRKNLSERPVLRPGEPLLLGPAH